MDDFVDRTSLSPAAANPEAILAAVAAATIAVDEVLTVRYVNAAAEQLFQTSALAIIGEGLSNFLSPHGAVMSLVDQAKREGGPVSAYGVSMDTPRTGVRTLTVHVAPMSYTTGWLVLSLQEQTRALKIGQQLEHRKAARSMTAMASLLAHEVKNPLSGIRGAAQLLEQNAPEDEKHLTQLICDECDRIVALVDRMDVFSDERPLARSPVNIHIVLERVRRIAENGFAKSVKIVERYDPSLPPVDGNNDQLVQAFLNLVKNAAEASPQTLGEIVITTSYKQGVRVSLPGSTAGRVQLPLVVTIQDNGPGISDDIRPYLFDPFITTKSNGSGLGLALVAKIVADHGGIIEFESESKRTLFRVMLPIINTGEVVND